MSFTHNACPHCGSQHSRLLSDHNGSVGWCGECHRAWIVPLRWPMQFYQPRPVERQRRIA